MPQPRSRKIKEGDKVPVSFTQAERKLITDHTFANPKTVAMATVKDSKLVVRFTLGELEDLIGHIAAEANHTEDKKIQLRLDKLFERLEEELGSYDDGLLNG